MSKKIPISILTLTLLAGSITSGTAWADSGYSQTGPWSFDEMMSAESEVQDYINANCPIYGPSQECFNDYTAMRSEENPIYTELHSFEYPNFHILSIDTAPDANGKNTLEYYFRSENVIEKYSSYPVYTYDEYGNILEAHYDGATYFHRLTKLYIYQSEMSYEIDPYSTDLEALAASPHHRILYSGVKSPDEDSLLPTDQKGTIEIEPATFDPSYAQVISYYFEDETGVRFAYGTYTNNCREGSVCTMQYTPYDSYPFLASEPTYDDGYNDGYNSGYWAGRSDGYWFGYEDGYNNAYESSYNSGYMDGQNVSYDVGFTDGYNSGHEEGYNTGHVNGFNAGYDTGFNDGRSEGYLYGQSDGYQAGQNDGYQTGQNDGYLAGQSEGYLIGYNEGYDAGYTASMNNRTANEDNREESISDSIPTTDTIILSDNTTIINQPTTELDSNLGIARLPIDNTETNALFLNANLGVKSKSIPSTPNTGSHGHEIEPETKKEGKIDFPWWLGAILVLGLIALLWFFLPDFSKKSNKKGLTKIKN